ncbi:MAG TPA: ROK family protein [Patescibacteria group bacterium]|nr:ROK family protein [Patescibacteria group bacterium]
MYLVFDIGGTHIRLGLVNESLKLVSSKIINTPESAVDGLDRILEFVGEQKIYKTVGGIAGVFDKDRNTIFKSPNLHGWEGFKLKSSLEKQLGSEVFLENDAALAALGEAVYGAGKGFRIAAYITISTGVGGARIVNGKIDEKSFGFEPGSQIISLSLSQSLSLGKSGKRIATLEDLISGSSIKRIYKKDAESLTEKRVWKDIVKKTAVGLTNVTVFWSPDIIILGGGVSSSDYFDLNQVRTEMEKLNRKFPKLPFLRKSSLGEYSGIYGGIALLRNL